MNLTSDTGTIELVLSCDLVTCDHDLEQDEADPHNRRTISIIVGAGTQAMIGASTIYSTFKANAKA